MDINVQKLTSLAGQKEINIMKYLFTFILILGFLKSFYYGLFEIKEKENKYGGIAVIFIAILGLILPTALLFILY